jgi:hypothetical protein
VEATNILHARPAGFKRVHRGADRMSRGSNAARRGAVPASRMKRPRQELDDPVSREELANAIVRFASNGVEQYRGVEFMLRMFLRGVSQGG